VREADVELARSAAPRVLHHRKRLAPARVVGALCGGAPALTRAEGADGALDVLLPAAVLEARADRPDLSEEQLEAELAEAEAVLGSGQGGAEAIAEAEDAGEDTGSESDKAGEGVGETEAPKSETPAE
jgi:hypothetical protein